MRFFLPMAVVAAARLLTSTQASMSVQYAEVPVSHTSSSSSASADAGAAFNPYNDTEFWNDIKRNVYRGPSKEQREEEARQRRSRARQRRARARATLAALSAQGDRNAVGEQQPEEQAEGGSRRLGGVQRLTKEEVQNVQRKTSWFGGDGAYSYNAALDRLADPSGDYDKWAQAYRYLGAFIDCDHDKSEGSGDRNNNNNNENGGYGACSRWMMWAAYYNPNYQGYEYEEYFGDEPKSVLDCHNPDTEWELIGVYRQEFYQFIEQISKHLWAIDDYEYIVARAGLMYMTDEDCFQVGQDNNGNAIRAGVAPQPNGQFHMALYSDSYCLTPDDSLGTYDDYVAQTDVDLGSKDDGDGQNGDDLYEWWYDTQEYTLTNLNAVYEEYMYCTPCMDYPTYQDGYFIGDYGTDDDDLINQCWKFHSHDSFVCEAECVAMGHSQGSINQILYGDKVFGTAMQASSYTDGSGRSKADVLVESSWSRIMANAFLTFSFLLFIATFLAFAVARRSRYRESRSSKSRRLLDDGYHVDDGGHRSVRSRRSRSRKSSKSTSGKTRSSSSHRHHQSSEGDGLFRTDDASERRSSRRSKSRSKRGRSKNGDAKSERGGSSKPRSSGSVGRSTKSRSKDRTSAATAAAGSDPPTRKSSRSVREDNF